MLFFYRMLNTVVHKRGKKMHEAEGKKKKRLSKAALVLLRTLIESTGLPQLKICGDFLFNIFFLRWRLNQQRTADFPLCLLRLLHLNFIRITPLQTKLLLCCCLFFFHFSE